MSRENPRKTALEAIEAVRLPSGWTALTPHRDWERWTHRWAPETSARQDVELTGQLHFQALGGHKAGMVLVGGHGCEIYCRAKDTQAAVDHILAWMDR